MNEMLLLEEPPQSFSSHWSEFSMSSNLSMFTWDAIIIDTNNIRNGTCFSTHLKGADLKLCTYCFFMFCLPNRPRCRVATPQSSNSAYNIITLQLAWLVVFVPGWECLREDGRKQEEGGCCWGWVAVCVVRRVMLIYRPERKPIQHTYTHSHQ